MQLRTGFAVRPLLDPTPTTLAMPLQSTNMLEPSRTSELASRAAKQHAGGSGGCRPHRPAWQPPGEKLHDASKVVKAEPEVASHSGNAGTDSSHLCKRLRSRMTAVVGISSFYGVVQVQNSGT